MATSQAASGDKSITGILQQQQATWYPSSTVIPSDGPCQVDSTTMRGTIQNIDENSSMAAASKVLHEAEEEMNLFSWCEQCQANSIGECIIHAQGKVITISDNKPPSHARLSLPSILTLKKVADSDGMEGKEGVFAKRQIRFKTQFGPIEAPLLHSGAFLPPHVFDVRVMKGGEVVEQLDLTKEDECNWMMFVRPGRCSQETNLAAYQIANHIYYIATRAISANTELRVWYLQSYGQQFGKQPLPATLPQPQVCSDADEDGSETIFEGSQESALPAPATVGVATRSNTTISEDKLNCSLCNTKFSSFPRLVQHKCPGLNETQSNDSSPRARRKSRPRKMSGTGLQPATKKAKAASQATPTTATSTLPTVMSLRKTDTQQAHSLMELVVADSTVTEQPPLVKKRGRPPGSKNRQTAESKPKKANAPQNKRTKYNCSHCERSFYSEDQHRVHEAEHTGTKPYVCQHQNCGKGFGSKFKWMRHKQVHEQPGNRKCPCCDKTFNRVDHLKNHLDTHSSNRQMYSCDKCGKEYLYKATYVYHMALHEAQDSSDLECSLCKLMFADRNSLVEHVRTTHNRYKPDQERPKKHKCQQCDKTFTTAKDVARHMVTHTKLRPFLCENCPQQFARSDHLQRHYKSNHKQEWLQKTAKERAGPENHTCMDCLKHFSSEKHLEYHMNHEHANQVIGKATKRPRGSKNAGTVKQTVVLMQNSLQQADNAVISLQQPMLQQQNQLQHLSILAQPHPVQLQVNRNSQELIGQLQGHQTDVQSMLSTSFITSVPVGNGQVVSIGTGDQTLEVVTEADVGNMMTTLKAVPYTFPTQVIAPSCAASLGPSAITVVPVTSTFNMPLSSNLQQSISSTDLQGQQQQQANSQQQVTLTFSPNEGQYPGLLVHAKGQLVFTPDSSKGQVVLPIDAADQFKQWIASNMPHTSNGVTDHAYASGPTSSASLSTNVFSLATTPVTDMETHNVQQSSHAGVLNADLTSSSGLQADWNSSMDLAFLPVQDLPVTTGTGDSSASSTVTQSVS